MSLLQQIPCNIISGFLGSGKTTAILHLLKHKPAGERWGVLVNEFGQTGIDGQVIAAQNAYVKEVAGGCMCCSTGVSMQVALNELIRQSRPQRVLIEPSGIGHPRQIIRQLSLPPFQELLDIRACITLLDPRQLQDRRYTEHPLFNEQIHIADVLVANKTDQSSQQDQDAFLHFLQQLAPAKLASGWLEQGQLDPAWLDLPHRAETKGEPLKISAILGPSDSPPDPGHFHTASWHFPAETCFQQAPLLALFQQLKAERIKALLNTDKGPVFINHVTGNSHVTLIPSQQQSTIEIIHRDPINKDDISKQLAACIQKD